MMLRSVAFAFACILSFAACSPPAGSVSDAGEVQTGADAASPGRAPSADSLVGARPSAVADAGVVAGAPVEPLQLGEALLRYPTNLQMVMLGYRLRDAAPPIETWSRTDGPVQAADEFTRPQAVASFIARMQQAYDTTADIGRVQLRIGGHLSEYDAAAGGFYLSALQPGGSVAFATPDADYVEVALQFDNAAAAYLWRIAPEAARAAFERNSGLREATVDVSARIVGIETRGDAAVIHAVIERYAVYGHNNRVGLLGEQDVAAH